MLLGIPRTRGLGTVKPWRKIEDLIEQDLYGTKFSEEAISSLKDQLLERYGTPQREPWMTDSDYERFCRHRRNGRDDDTTG